MNRFDLETGSPSAVWLGCRSQPIVPGGVSQAPVPFTVMSSKCTLSSPAAFMLSNAAFVSAQYFSDSFFPAQCETVRNTCGDGRYVALTFFTNCV